uniref:Uncharacterized protein n=1 Tax=Glossina austeni TaxID=7395 RepID=A0A1A9UM55_GLOAU
MGATASKNMISNTIKEENENLKSWIPEVQNLTTPMEVDAQFNKLYLHSREALHAMRENASDELIGQMVNMIKQNKKQLSESFDDAIMYRAEIGELVRQRLTPRTDVYNIPSLDIDNVESYISSRSYFFDHFAHKKSAEQTKNESTNNSNIATSNSAQKNKENGDGIDIINKRTGSHDDREFDDKNWLNQHAIGLTNNCKSRLRMYSLIVMWCTEWLTS